MRINTNVSALNAFRNLGQAQSASTDSIGKLSSGFRINRAGDDAAGLAIANKMRAEGRSLTQASRNVEQANSMLQIAEGGAGSVQKILERMKELATQAASDNNSTQLTALDEEFTALKSEIDRVVGSTKYQGTALLDGTFNGTFQVGATNASNNQLAVTLQSGTAAEGLSTTHLGINGDSLTSAANARTAMTNIDTALGEVNGTLADIGAYQNRLEYAQTNLKTAIQNTAAAESVIRDVDMAEEMTKFSKNQILSQAGTAMLAQANQSTQGVLQLLRG